MRGNEMNSVLYQFLNEQNRLKNRLQEIDLEIEDLRSAMLPGAIRYDKDNVMVTPEDHMIEYAAKIEPLAKKRAVIQREYDIAYHEVSKALDHLVPKQAIVMRMKYFDRKSNGDIAECLNVSRRRIMQICNASYEILLNIALTSPLKYDIL